MSALKLTMAASIGGKPYNWVRTITFATPTAVTATATNSSSLTIKASPTLNSKAESISVVGWRMPPCAPPAHDKGSGKSYLGFRGHKSFAFSTTPYSSSEDKGGGSSGLVADMGSENNNAAAWYTSDRKQPPPSPPQHQQPSKVLTLPTILTLGRVAAVPLLVCTFYIDSWRGTTATTSIFIAAAITDWLDGYIARKMRLGTAFGAFLDPVADKLMVAATLVLLCTKPMEVAIFGQAPWLFTVPSIAIIGREITMSAVREWAASQNGKLSEAVAVNNLGKWKTATQMTALTILLATRDSSLAGPGFLVATGVVLLYISAGLAVLSLVVYMKKIWKVLLK
ncbi:CDP-diacylglycerol--glycerol-3-phosphate 3-phosphatidyltransferase 2 [Malania oleifera]|uniref:CDP-diacylglycerol--glycerol-3-phosphate 3-phosphatidyltransferase 2 n=1 Tax=Malania oleifera TaxID=397392 RepID=UPI0025AEBCDC|nr:CDP-diacylglycerol--glycerol-3-phosphate 3-phosphatidyltransferase 2 [Malania oleifera]